MARIVRESGSIEKNRFNSFVISSLISSILFFLIGLLVFIFAKEVSLIIGYIVGVVFLYTGLITIYKYFKRDGAKLYSLNLIFGIIMSVIGLIIMLVPTSVASFINICFGLYLIILGANKISYGTWFKIGNDKAWLITITVGLMLILFGIIVVINPFEASMTATKIVGLFLMISSILDFTSSILLKARSDEIVEIFW